jgi:hypothetical protein
MKQYLDKSKSLFHGVNEWMNESAFWQRNFDRACCYFSSKLVTGSLSFIGQSSESCTTLNYDCWTWMWVSLHLFVAAPSYEECMSRGRVSIKDDNDSEFVRGNLSWAPMYPIYRQLSQEHPTIDNNIVWNPDLPTLAIFFYLRYFVVERTLRVWCRN